MNSILKFLTAEQRPDGSFNGLVFHTALILTCLENLKDNKLARPIIDKGVGFLLKEKRGNWTWNYWDKPSIPNDLDDTSVALSAIKIHRPELIDGKVLAKFIKNLIGAEIKTGGPYNTWLVPGKLKKEWRDVDVVVNSNIAYFLSLENIRLPSINELAEEFIKHPKPKSKYYFSPVVIFYFISRFYQGNLKNRAIMEILKLPKKNPLESALAASALIRFDGKTSKLKILKSWKGYPLYVEEYRAGEPQKRGSPALTAAFTLEALALSEKTKVEEKDKFLASKIIKRVKDKVGASPTIDKIIDNDPHNRITLLALNAARAFGMPIERKKRLIFDLGAANLLGWLAYEIYDDILDETAQIKNLPVANLALMEVFKIYHSILKPSQLKYFYAIMEDEEKSLGHALGPITLLLTSGYSWESAAIQKLLNFFKHYLTARQLNDDAHDWRSDLERKIPNKISALIESGQKEERVLEKVGKKIIFHLQQARKALVDNSAIKDKTYFENLLKPLSHFDNYFAFRMAFF